MNKISLTALVASMFLAMVVLPKVVIAQAVGTNVKILGDTNLRLRGSRCTVLEVVSQDTIAVVDGPAIVTKCTNGVTPTTLLPVSVKGKKFLVSQTRIAPVSTTPILKLGTATVTATDGLNLRDTNLTGEIIGVIPYGTKVDVKSVNTVLVNKVPRQQARVIVKINEIWVGGFADARYLVTD
jgi:hypothetical protein